MNLDDIPFSYGDLSGLEHRIIYYESSRGCPFSCSYCLSSIDKKVRFRSLSLVTRELQFFLDRKVPQVKFVDRTFNCKKSHSMAIWQYLLEHDNGITNFHFEISSDLLDDDELALMKQMRPGLIQLEIGVQTTNLVVVKEIRRTMDLDKVARRVAQVNTFGNIHQHLDLIAGLPYEDIEKLSSFLQRCIQNGAGTASAWLSEGAERFLYGRNEAEIRSAQPEQAAV
ncbi:MAG: radical SAM protein [Clostridium sp.]